MAFPLTAVKDKVIRAMVKRMPTAFFDMGFLMIYSAYPYRGTFNLSITFECSNLQSNLRVVKIGTMRILIYNKIIFFFTIK